MGRVHIAAHHLATRLGKQSVEELIPSLPPLEPDRKSTSGLGRSLSESDSKSVSELDGKGASVLDRSTSEPDRENGSESGGKNVSEPDRKNVLELDRKSISVPGAISLLLRHVGIESCRIVPGPGAAVSHTFPLSFLRQCCDLLACGVEERCWDNVGAVLMTLQAVLHGFFDGGRQQEEEWAELRERVRCVLLRVWV